MTRRLAALDRFAALLLGLALVALALLVLDWEYGGPLGLSGTVDTSATSDVVTASWWPWVFAVAGVVLGLLGLVWLLAHLRRVGPSALRLEGSDETGRLETDLRSVASAAAAHLAATAPVTDVRGSTRTLRGHTLIELRGHVDRDADVASLLASTRSCSEEVAAAFPADSVSCRVVLDAPRRKRTGRVNRVRVQ